MTRACTIANRALAFAAAALLLATASSSLASPAGPDDQGRASVAVEPGVHVATRLNTPRRFHGPIPTLDAVRAMIARPGMATDIETVFQAAGLPHLAGEAVALLRAGTGLREVTVAPGTRLEWMAQRRRGRPELLRTVQWGGKTAFAAYEFLLDDGARGYTFVLPTACANLSLARVGPSPKAAAADAARAEDARRAADAAREAALTRADDERRAAEAKAADARRADEARAAEAKAAGEARRAADEAKRAEEARQAADAAERDRRAKVDVFLAALGGKERRVREVTSGATTTVGGRCAGLVGAKGGVDLRLGASSWRLAPGVGVAVNTRDSDHSSLFGEVELNYWLGDKGFIGTGVGAWDVTHADTRAATWLLHAGREIARSSRDVRLLLAAEGRLFLDETDDIANNYQAWAGLRVVFR